jgi:hypothetical protein
MRTLSSKSAASRLGALCALFVFGFTTSTGCIWLDDFGKFKIGDAGASDRPDAAAGPDGASSERCQDVDCSDLDQGCVKGVCDPATGACKTENLANGSACFDGNPCTFADRCTDGTCAGDALDCSALNDACSDGVCDPETGGCTFGPIRVSNSCDDANACTTNDRCTEDPAERCRGEQAPEGTSCTDFNSCTGTDDEPDVCGDRGEFGFGCIPGAAVASGTVCDDFNECTASDKCDGEGECKGDAVREGERCWQACASNTLCRAGECVPEDEGDAPIYNNQCLSSFCGAPDLCREEWKTDLVCHCGCGYEDPACSPCSPYMCQSLGDHKAARWCDDSGEPADNCSEDLRNDGKCDCGCQFEDPDCNGGACCSGTNEAGCDDSYIEECVCGNGQNGDASCCTDEWTERCAQLAVNLGCMLCP